MNRNIECFRIAYQNMRVRRKQTRVLVFMMILALVCCILGNSIVSSYKDSLSKMCNRGLGRLKIMDDENGELLEEIRDKVSGIEGVGGVTRVVYYLYGEVKNMESELGDDSIPVTLRSEFKAINDYGVSGKTENLEYDEIIIPEYLYGIGTIGQYEYVSGSEFIGMNIVIQCDTAGERTFRIVGTYDNVQLGDMGNEFYINSQMADDIQGIVSDITEQLLQEEYKEYLEEDPTLDISVGIRHYIGIYIEEGYDMGSVCEEIVRVTGQDITDMKIADETVIQMYEFVGKIINIFVVMLTSVCFISIVMMFGTELKRRMREAALYMAFGYEKKNVIKIFIAEKAFMSVKALVYSVFISVVTIWIMDYWVHHFLEFYKRYITFSIQTDKIMTGCVIAMGAVCISIAMVILYLRKKTIVNNLKQSKMV